MKQLPWILVVLLAIACVVSWFRPHEPLPAEIRTETKIQTVVKLDTVLISKPIAQAAMPPPPPRRSRQSSLPLFM